MVKNKCLNHTSHYTLPSSLKGIENLIQAGLMTFSTFLIATKARSLHFGTHQTDVTCGP